MTIGHVRANGAEIPALGLGTATLMGGAEMCMPGDNAKVEVTLISPIAMDEGVRFAIREGGKTVGSGVVTKIVE